MKALFNSLQATGHEFFEEVPFPWKAVMRRSRMVLVMVLISSLCSYTEPSTWSTALRQKMEIVWTYAGQLWGRWVPTPKALAAEPAPAAIPTPLPPVHSGPRPVVRATGMQCRTNSSRLNYVFHFEGHLDESKFVAAGVLVIARIEVGKDIIMAQGQTKRDGTYALEVPFTSHLYERVDWSLSTQSVDGKFIETSGHRILTGEDHQIRIETDGKFQIAERT